MFVSTCRGIKWRLLGCGVRAGGTMKGSRTRHFPLTQFGLHPSSTHTWRQAENPSAPQGSNLGICYGSFSRGLVLTKVVRTEQVLQKT